MRNSVVIQRLPQFIYSQHPASLMKNDFKNSRFKPTLELVFYIVVKNLEELLINIIIRTYRIEEGKKTISTNYLDPRCIINPEF